MSDITLEFEAEDCYIEKRDMQDGGFVWKIIDREGDVLKMKYSVFDAIPEGWKDFAKSYKLQKE